MAAHTPAMCEYFATNKEFIFKFRIEKEGYPVFDRQKNEVILPFDMVDPKSKSDDLKDYLQEMSKDLGLSGDIDFNNYVKNVLPFIS